MALKDKIAALLGKKSSEADLKKGVSALLKAEEEDKGTPEGEEEDKPEGEEDEDRPEGEEDEDDTSAETDDEENAEEDEEEPSAKATGPKAGFALARSSVAKGRERLANSLGEKVAAGKMSYGEAKNLLADAPKSARLTDAMRGRDVNPGAGGGSHKAGASLSAAMDRQLAQRGLKPVQG